MTKRPTRPSPNPTISLITSSAIIEPSTPVSAPKMPASAQAGTLLQLAGVLGPSADLDALNERMRMSELFAASGPKQVAEASLTRRPAAQVLPSSVAAAARNATNPSASRAS